MYVTTPKLIDLPEDITEDYRLLMYVTTPKLPTLEVIADNYYRLLMYVTTPKCQIQGFFDIFNLNCF